MVYTDGIAQNWRTLLELCSWIEIKMRFLKAGYKIDGQGKSIFSEVHLSFVLIHALSTICSTSYGLQAFCTLFLAYVRYGEPQSWKHAPHVSIASKHVAGFVTHFGLYIKVDYFATN